MFSFSKRFYFKKLSDYHANIKITNRRIFDKKLPQNNIISLKTWVTYWPINNSLTAFVPTY